MKAVLDRFEGEIAVFDVKGKEKHVRRTLLPTGLSEGDVVDLATLTRDVTATRRAKARVTRKLAGLTRKKGAPPGDFDL